MALLDQLPILLGKVAILVGFLFAVEGLGPVIFHANLSSVTADGQNALEPFFEELGLANRKGAAKAGPFAISHSTGNPLKPIVICTAAQRLANHYLPGLASGTLRGRYGTLCRLVLTAHPRIVLDIFDDFVEDLLENLIGCFTYMDDLVQAR